jgi:hypothetical protein
VTKFIRISIADKNDNPPYFDKHLYEAEVDENEDIQHTVLTVTANDKDECESPMIYFLLGRENKNQLRCSEIKFFDKLVVWSNQMKVQQKMIGIPLSKKSCLQVTAISNQDDIC